MKLMKCRIGQIKNILDEDVYCRAFITWNQSEIIELLQVAKQNGLTSYFITLLLSVMRPSLYSHVTLKTEPPNSNAYVDSDLYEDMEEMIGVITDGSELHVVFVHQGQPGPEKSEEGSDHLGSNHESQKDCVSTEVFLRNIY